MFRTDLLSIIWSLYTVFTAIGICHTSMLTVCKRQLADVNILVREIPTAVNTVLRLLMMDSKSVRNM